ncbi:MAG: DUF308 domain-containing protein [Candidatus Promineofilum sp.]|nr:DUF308 domain-containing protein [Promineifilum sp.]
MTNDIKSQVTQAAKGAVPWRKGIAWWVVLLEGLALLALGLYMFFAKPTTAVILGWVVALSLLASGALSLYLSLQTAERTLVRQWTLIHGAVGVAAGLLAIIVQLFSPGAALTVLGLGCLAYGGVGLYLLLDKNLTALRRLSFISTIFYLVLGGLIVLHALGLGTLVTTLQIVSLLLIAAGIILLFWGIILRNERGR